MNARNGTILVEERNGTRNRKLAFQRSKNAKILTWDIVPSESLDLFLLVLIRVVCCAPKTFKARS